MVARVTSGKARNSREAKPGVRSALAELRALGNPAKAKFAARYFKTGKGQYGEGDRFLGVTVPEIRKLTLRYSGLTLPQCLRLLESPYNEARLLGLLVMVRQFGAGDATARARICASYLRHRRRVNNWNLVDSSAPHILGAQLLNADRRILGQLVRSHSLWDRRIAVIATQHFIRAGEFAPTLRLVEGLLCDEQDLMHKACGWMLREIGDRSRATLEAFLGQHYPCMPRTMLRYAIEKLPPRRRAAYLTGKVLLARSPQK
jgi:3-methyladenine DNA glycosylase AlkD